MDSESAVASNRALERLRSSTIEPPPTSQLKLSHLRMIVALEEFEMVSAAARAVHISQPAASRMIAEMEGLLQAQLCARHSRGVRPSSHAKRKPPLNASPAPVVSTARTRGAGAETSLG